MTIIFIAMVMKFSKASCDLYNMYIYIQLMKIRY